MQYVLRLAAIILLLSSCNSYKTKYPYSLNDFKPELRRHLEKIVQNGGRCDEDIDYENNTSTESTYTYFKNNVSISDLKKLINSEHPILRAYSFKFLCQKDSSDIDNLLLQHLDDTAIITWCRGEWGEKLIYVSDYFLVQRNSINKVFSPLLKDEIIKNHNYLHAAYLLIYEMDKPEEKYYSFIKLMIKKARKSEDLYTVLYSLSTYRKKEDIPFIADELFANWKRFGFDTFKLIADNPDTAYFKIVEQYFRYISHGKTENEIQINFYRSSNNLSEKYNSFIEALASYKNKKSAAILGQIINRKIYPAYDDTELSRRENEVYDIICKNTCIEYKTFLSQLKPQADAYKKKYVILASE